MLPYGDLLVALAGVPRITVHGPWSRTLEYALLRGAPPGRTGTRAEPLWAGGAARNGARFTPVGSFPTLYLASDPVTALVEVGSIFGHALLPTTTTIARNPVVVVSVEGVLADVVDLTSKTTCTALGTTASELTGSWLLATPAPTHELGRAAYDLGAITALKYPSAKHAAGWCLAVLPDRLSLNRANYIEVVDSSASLAQRLP